MKGLGLEDLLKAILAKDSAELEEEENSEEGEEPKVAAVEVVSVGEPPEEELEDDFPLPSGMKEDLMMEEEEGSDEYEDEDPNSVECLLRKLLKK